MDVCLQTSFARHTVSASDLLNILDLREPKIPDFKVSVLVEKQIGRLKVSVDDYRVAVVQETQRSCQLH